MKLPLWNTKGFSDFQIGFVKQYTKPTKSKTIREHAKSLFWWVLYGGTGAGLWYQHLYPETTPTTVVNFTTFGVWFVMVCAFFSAIFLCLFAAAAVVSTIGFEGIKAAAKQENALDKEGKPIADSMSAMAHTLCKALLPTFNWNPSILLSSLIQDALVLTFFTGLIVTGWTFFAVCYFFIWGLKLFVGRMIKGLVVSHVKSLTPERVSLLTQLEKEIKNENGGEIIVVDVVRNQETGEMVAEHTETFQLPPPQDA